MNEAHLIDCVEYMKTLPDNAFDLAVVDPPYGDGLHAEDGGKGWFTKYNQRVTDVEHRNLRGRFDRYNNAETCSQSVQVERADRTTGSDNASTDTSTQVRNARHGQGKNVRQPDGTWGYAKWRTDAGGATV